MAAANRREVRAADSAQVDVHGDATWRRRGRVERLELDGVLTGDERGRDPVHRYLSAADFLSRTNVVPRWLYSGVESASMPKYVDHDARRRFIAATAAQLVATRGLDALTFRNVAVAAGSSTTVVTHYFADKRELLLWTFQIVAERSGARFDKARERGGGLRECLESLLPLDAARQTDWRLLTCYWGMAVSDSGLASAQARHVRSGQRRIEVLLREQYPDRDPRELEVV